MKNYSKKQIFEAISYWQKQLKKQLNESDRGLAVYNQTPLNSKQFLDKINVYKYRNAVQVLFPNGEKYSIIDLDVKYADDDSIICARIHPSFSTSRDYDPKNGIGVMKLDEIKYRIHHFVNTHGNGSKPICVRNDDKNYQSLLNVVDVDVDNDDIVTFICK